MGIRNWLVVVVCFAGISPLCAGKVLVGETRDGTTVTIQDAAGSGLDEMVVMAVEDGEARKFTFMVCEVDNTHGKKAFSFIPSSWTALTTSGQEFKNHSLSITTMLGTTLDDTAKKMFSGTIEPRDKQRFVLLFSDKVAAEEIVKVRSRPLLVPRVECK